ncbi:MAG: D-alanyl-D-alanine carboxypeptidase [Clostridia bacterium]|nr:D-alanyl-D-alanine carboxypeptidase [Clostridia bacterium]
MKSLRKSFFVFVAVLVLFISAVIPVSAITGYEQKLQNFTADMKAAMIIDVTNENVIYSKNADSKIAVASTAKLVTSLVALKYIDPEQVFTVGKELELVKPGSSLCLIKEGHQLKLKTLIAGMLVPSGNDAAYTVAVNVARTVAKNPKMTDTEAVNYFSALMNTYCRDIGCKNTNFVSPEGWDDPKNYSTAHDMSLVAREALKNSAITTITSTYSRRYYFASGENIVWSNTNELLSPGGEYYYPFAMGLKTGTTDAAGRCLISAAIKGGRQILILAYGCPYETGDKEKEKAVIFGNTRDIFNFIFNAPTNGDVDLSGDISSADARIVLRASVGLEEITDVLLKRGDVDNDKTISSADARIILRVSVGLESL